MLTLERFLEEQHEYWVLLRQALPDTRISERTLEIADFSLTNPDYVAGINFTGDRSAVMDGEDMFDRIGLGIHVIENKADEPILNGAMVDQGYCGKILVWKPGQFLPDHRHQTVFVLKRNLPHKHNLDFMMDLLEVNPEFETLKQYDANFPIGEFSYMVPRAATGLTSPETGSIVQLINLHGGTVKPGKRETFYVVSGHGWYIGPRLEGDAGLDVNTIKDKIPESQRDFVYRGEDVCCIPMVPGGAYALPANCNHSVVAGPKGLVAFEFSKRSFDGADLFTCPSIRRETKILMQSDDNRIITAGQYFAEKGLRKLVG